MKFINSEPENKLKEPFQEISTAIQQQLKGGQFKGRTSSKSGDDDDDVDIPDPILWDLAGGN